MIYVTEETYIAIGITAWLMIGIIAAAIADGVYTAIKVSRVKQQTNAIRLRIINLQLGLSRQFFNCMIAMITG